MDGCHEFRSLLFRVAEGEAGPEEALRVARHLPSCTTCRIVLAREIRLARVLESLDDSIPVEEAFLDEVMRSLPEEPPRAGAPSRPPARRGLKLAGLLGALILGAAGAVRMGQIVSHTEIRSPLPRLHAGSLEGVLETVSGAARLAFALLDQLSAGLALDPPSLHFGFSVGVAALVPGALAIVALSALVAVFARCEPRG